jgi:hypothetical protein
MNRRTWAPCRLIRHTGPALFRRYLPLLGDLRLEALLRLMDLGTGALTPLNVGPGRSHQSRVATGSTVGPVSTLLGGGGADLGGNLHFCGRLFLRVGASRSCS